jgi:putative transposase
MRKKRLNLEGCTYHTMSRLIELRNLLALDEMKVLFEESIRMAQEKYQFELANYQIMDNHVHLLIKTLPGEAGISRIMQNIKSRFAQKFNALTKRTGPVWNERFKDTIVEFADNPRLYLFTLILYFANNPVRAGKVKSPTESWWGASKAYFDTHFKPNVAITLHKFFLDLGRTIEECIETLQRILCGDLWI